MRRAAWLLAAAAAIAALAWILLGGGAPPDPAEDPAREPEAAAPPLAAGPLAGPAAAAHAEAPPAVARAAAAEPEPAEGPRPGVAPPAGEGLLVRVLHAETREPIPGAEILFADMQERDMARVQELLLETRDVETVLERISVLYRAGTDGVARVPAVAGDGILAARAADLFGVATESLRGAREVEVLCVASKSVAARVTDRNGRPAAGVPVALYVLREFGEHSPLALRTGADGVARFRRLELFLREEAVTGAALAIGGPIEAGERAAFDPAAPPAEPIQLTLPAFGEVEVEVLDAAGEPWAGPAQVAVQILREGESPDSRLDPTGGGVMPLREGRARFAPVGLGLALHVGAARADGTRIVETAAAGPLREGETTRVTLRESLQYSHLAGRLVDERGAPLSSARIQLEIRVEHGGGDSGEWSGLRTGEDGAFRLELREAGLPEGATRTLRFREEIEPGGSPRTAERDLSWALPPGDTDLGDVVMSAAPLLVSGVAVDESGAPAAGIDVQVQSRMRFGDAPDQWYWNYLQDGYARTGADGAFAVHLRTDVAELLVTAFQQGAWTDGVEAAPGTTGLRIVMRRGARLEGRVLFDAGQDAAAFQLLLRPREESPSQWPRVLDLEQDGSFSHLGLRPGAYDLELRPRGGTDALLTIERLTLAAGENRDPRLDPIDARGKALTHELRAIGPDGVALKSFRAYRLRPDGSSESLRTRDGVIRVPAADGPAELIVMAEGCLQETVSGMTGPATVRFSSGVAVRVSVRLPGTLPEDARIVVGLLPRSNEGRRVWERLQTEVGPDGAAVLTAGALGETRVMIDLTCETGGQYRAIVLVHDLDTIVVPAGGGAWTAIVEAASFAAALRALGD